MSALAGFQCGCDGSRPCMEPDNECVPAVWVACGDCDRSGTEECLYAVSEIVSDGCFFSVIDGGERQ